MMRKTAYLCMLMSVIPASALAQGMTQAPIYPGLRAMRAQAEQTERLGHEYEQRGDWAAALNQYRAAAETEDITPLPEPFDLLVTSSCRLDAARMLSQLNQADSAEFRSDLQKAQEAANKALGFVSLSPEYRALAYNNLGFAQWMAGDAASARTAFSAAVGTNAAPAPARNGLNAVDEFLKRNQALMAPQRRPSGMTDEQWRKLRDVVIDAGVIFLRKAFPVGSSVIGLLLHAVNDQ
jgi:tetratricopeptide (TPR) repeat protein